MDCQSLHRWLCCCELDNFIRLSFTTLSAPIYWFVNPSPDGSAVVNWIIFIIIVCQSLHRWLCWYELDNFITMVCQSLHRWLRCCEWLYLIIYLDNLYKHPKNSASIHDCVVKMNFAKKLIANFTTL